ncbi:MAG: hypothetical protein A2W05_06710 [Candidatus Schekmanbacteria bacterium RBG_16_38_10]|uniref:Methyltransferase type 11 domain-containing protein n=1 Tax=Candidatus Schekmanbacteria bacterium RBG_16_38_10 TaxID=1817879 RepID=A0A1F7RMA9_9BACT|nr:MAG: hypothetical protein A2W05_06710 [Candidatus Schekmanbacteria bacterium RBG_16_38_10]
MSYEDKILTKVFRNLDRNSKILDIGCGLGQKIDLLKKEGFLNITGVEKNPSIVKKDIERGLDVYTVEQFNEKYSSEKYDLIFMSHIIEHFHYNDLIIFMEKYLMHLKNGGYLLIMTPVFQEEFYNDFDHVKPYSPQGILQVFGEKNSNFQYFSDISLELVDLRYIRRAFQLKYWRSLSLQTSFYRLPRMANQLLHLIYRLSFRIFGKTHSWIGLYRKI